MTVHTIQQPQLWYSVVLLASSVWAEPLGASRMPESASVLDFVPEDIRGSLVEHVVEQLGVGSEASLRASLKEIEDAKMEAVSHYERVLKECEGRGPELPKKGWIQALQKKVGGDKFQEKADVIKRIVLLRYQSARDQCAAAAHARAVLAAGRYRNVGLLIADLIAEWVEKKNPGNQAQRQQLLRRADSLRADMENSDTFVESGRYHLGQKLMKNSTDVDKATKQALDELFPDVFQPNLNQLIEDIENVRSHR